MSGVSEMLALVALLGAALAALGVIAKVIQKAAQFIVRMSAAAHVILYELQPNAGTSIKDAISRMDSRVADLEEWRLRHDDRH